MRCKHLKDSTKIKASGNFDLLIKLGASEKYYNIYGASKRGTGVFLISNIKFCPFCGENIFEDIRAINEKEFKLKIIINELQLWLDWKKGLKTDDNTLIVRPPYGQSRGMIKAWIKILDSCISSDKVRNLICQKPKN